jgi:hypothetical protein
MGRSASRDQIVRQVLGLPSDMDASAPKLDRWFYAGASDSKPGMRMSLIGYGAFQYELKSGERVVWPIVCVALQRIT